MSEIFVTETARHDLKKLDPPVRERIIQKLEKYREAPKQFARKLTDPAIGEYRFRIGDYRVIFDMDGEDIVLLRVGHRKDIYR